MFCCIFTLEVEQNIYSSDIFGLPFAATEMRNLFKQNADCIDIFGLPVAAVYIIV